jgi:hypothetical protein
MQSGNTNVTGLERALLTNKAAQVAELVAVFVVAAAIVFGVVPVVGENPLARQGVVWIADVLMLVIVWLGLRLRRQNWEHFGLSFRLANWRAIFRAVLLSFVVFGAAISAFAVGAVVMANIIGRPESADMSGYNYLQGNLPMLILALAAVFNGVFLWGRSDLSRFLDQPHRGAGFR